MVMPGSRYSITTFDGRTLTMLRKCLHTTVLLVLLSLFSWTCWDSYIKADFSINAIYFIKATKFVCPAKIFGFTNE